MFGFFVKKQKIRAFGVKKPTKSGWGGGGGVLTTHQPPLCLLGDGCFFSP